MDKPTDFDTLINVLQNLMGQIKTSNAAYEFVNEQNIQNQKTIESQREEISSLTARIIELEGSDGLE